MAEEFVNLTEAAAILHISKDKMVRLAKEGKIKTYENPLDKRVKLVRRVDVEELKKPRPASGVAYSKPMEEGGKKLIPMPEKEFRKIPFTDPRRELYRPVP